MSTTRKLVAIGSGLALSSGLFSALPTASAAPDEWSSATWTKGQVVAQSLTVRTAPSSQAARTGTLRKGAAVSVICKAHGQNVGGNDVWYQLSPQFSHRWVAARYVKNVGAAPHWCKGNNSPVKATANLPVRTAPLTAAGQVRTIKKGTTFTAVCSTPSQDGVRNWYYLTDGRWVSSKYVVQNGPTAPCH